MRTKSMLCHLGGYTINIENTNDLLKDYQSTFNIYKGPQTWLKELEVLCSKVGGSLEAQMSFSGRTTTE